MIKVFLLSFHDPLVGEGGRVSGVFLVVSFSKRPFFFPLTTTLSKRREFHPFPLHFMLRGLFSLYDSPPRIHSLYFVF